MSKPALDKKNAGAIEEKATKEVAKKAEAQKKKEQQETEVAKNPEVPKEEKVDQKDVAQALAPAEKKKDEEKGAEKAAPEKDDKGKEAGEKAKEDEKEGKNTAEKDKKAEIAPGVKKVEDPAKAKAGEKGGKASEAAKFEEMGPKDKIVVDAGKAADQEKKAMGDAFFVASVAALANTDRNLLEKNVKENADRTYTVTLYEKDKTGELKPHEVIVNPSQPGPEMAEKGKEDDKTDRLMQIVKQAYVEWKGEDQLATGAGGAAMEALSGEPAEFMHSDNAEMWSKLTEACQWNQPILATAKGESTKAMLPDAQVKAWHVYVVLKCKEVGGKKMITLRKPHVADNTREGNTIEVDLEKFSKAYRGVTISAVAPKKEPEKKAEPKGPDKKAA